MRTGRPRSQDCGPEQKASRRTYAITESWMRDEAEKRIGHLYPKIEVTAEMVRKRPDLKPYEGRKVDGDRVALGTDG